MIRVGRLGQLVRAAVAPGAETRRTRVRPGRLGAARTAAPSRLPMTQGRPQSANGDRPREGLFPPVFARPLVRRGEARDADPDSACNVLDQP